MAIQEFIFNTSSGILTPAFPGPENRLSPVKLAPSLTLVRGQSIARKTLDSLFYPLNTGASDGTQIWGGFLQTSGATDASGNFYPGATAGTQYFTPPGSYANAYTGGFFNPHEVITGTLAAEVNTFTPGGTIAIGDVFTLTTVNPGGTYLTTSFTATGTTVANVAAGLVAAWNGNAQTAAYATASGGTTAVVLTGVTLGNILNVQQSATSAAGTFTKALTTAATGRAIADILAGAPGARVLQPTGYWLIP